MHRLLIRGAGGAALVAGLALTGAVALAAPVNTDAGHQTATMAHQPGGLGPLASQAAQAGLASTLVHQALALSAG
jgi:uncharacterized membrane protein AbrB (regulator of aidB expression)